MLLAVLGQGTIMSVATLAATTHSGLVNAQQQIKTFMQPQGTQSMTTNATNMTKQTALSDF
jgi:hypothetical protein